MADRLDVDELEPCEGVDQRRELLPKDTWQRVAQTLGAALDQDAAARLARCAACAEWLVFRHKQLSCRKLGGFERPCDYLKALLGEGGDCPERKWPAKLDGVRVE